MLLRLLPTLSTSHRASTTLARLQIFTSTVCQMASEASVKPACWKITGVYKKMEPRPVTC